MGANGRTFKLADDDENGYLAPAKERPPTLLEPEKGPYTQSSGMLSYYEICRNINDYNWTEVWLDEGKVPYAYGHGQWNPQWVGYDNQESILYKVEMAKDYNLGGIMWWSADMDDFTVGPFLSCQLIYAVNKLKRILFTKNEHDRKIYGRG